MPQPTLPQCQSLAQTRWVERQCVDLLDIANWHVVFTLPHDINPFAQGNPALIYSLLFRAASQTLPGFGRNPRWLGGELDELGLSANALSRALGVPVNRVTMILNGQRGVSADTALRLARYFGTTPQLWLNLQKTWELRQAEVAAGREIDEKVVPRQSAA